MCDPYVQQTDRSAVCCGKTLLLVGGRGHRLADVVEFPLECKAVETLKWKAEKQTDSAIQDKKCLAKRSFYLGFASMNCRWVWNAPMGGRRLSRPHRADLFRGVVANREHKVEPRRTGQREFIPGLAAQTIG